MTGTQLDHIGIAVRSLAEATKAYERLGLRVTAPEEVPTEGVLVAMIPLGETRIELLEPTTPEGAVARFLEERGPGLHHLAFAVRDLDAVCTRLRDEGVRLVYENPQPGEGGSRVNFIHPHSTGGVLIELTESPPGEPTP